MSDEIQSPNFLVIAGSNPLGRFIRSEHTTFRGALNALSKRSEVYGLLAAEPTEGYPCAWTATKNAAEFEPAAVTTDPEPPFATPADPDDNDLHDHEVTPS